MKIVGVTVNTSVVDADNVFVKGLIDSHPQLLKIFMAAFLFLSVIKKTIPTSARFATHRVAKSLWGS
jgi:hypothetical protein